MNIYEVEYKMNTTTEKVFVLANNTAIVEQELKHELGYSYDYDSEFAIKSIKIISDYIDLTK
jgi:hypothetical protein